MPGKWTDREVVALTLPNGKLLLEIPEGKELVGGIEIFIVLAVTALHFTIVSWCVWFLRRMSWMSLACFSGRCTAR